MTFQVPEKYRVTSGELASDPSYGNNGAFKIPLRLKGDRVIARVIASDQGGWRHVSVSFPHRTPSWAVMCAIKRMFWSDDECVVQYHPPAASYVNRHEHCLHLWQPIGVPMPVPPTWMVG